MGAGISTHFWRKRAASTEEETVVDADLGTSFWQRCLFLSVSLLLLGVLLYLWRRKFFKRPESRLSRRCMQVALVPMSKRAHKPSCHSLRGSDVEITEVPATTREAFNWCRICSSSES